MFSRKIATSTWRIFGSLPKISKIPSSFASSRGVASKVSSSMHQGMFVKRGCVQRNRGMRGIVSLSRISTTSTFSTAFSDKANSINYQAPQHQSQLQRSSRSSRSSRPTIQSHRYITSSSSESDYRRKVFCNVVLRSAALHSIGFDMDFTLAQYNSEFDYLAFTGALQKLHDLYHYPKEILDFKYNPDAFRRGLIIDKAKGNTLKIDRHKYVQKAYHGYDELRAMDRKAEYAHDVHSFTDSNFSALDTLFMVVDASLFAHLVDYTDKNPNKINKSYEQIYRDVRMCVDQCHQDGTIKEAVMKDPGRYIRYDDGLVSMLQQYTEDDKKVFLLTNSTWEYTNAVMDFLIHGKGENKNLKWQSVFDAIIVGANKPAFLTDSHLALFRVDPTNGSLRNVEDKTVLSPALLAKEGKIFQGGHWHDLHRMLDIPSGDRVLYVGDHMFSDIVWSKRTLGWRTVLIIPELEHELEIARTKAHAGKLGLEARRLQQELDEKLDALRQRQRRGEHVGEHLRLAEQQAADLEISVRNINDEFHAHFNPVWGQLMKAGYQDSRFGKQVIDYADLYTSRATNLGFVSPRRTFRPTPDIMAHDYFLINPDPGHA